MIPQPIRHFSRSVRISPCAFPWQWSCILDNIINAGFDSSRVSSAVVWRQTVLQVYKRNSRDVFAIPFPLKRRFGDLFKFLFFRFRIEFALLLLALYKSYISQPGDSIFDPNGRKVEVDEDLILWGSSKSQGGLDPPKYSIFACCFVRLNIGNK